MSEVSEAQREHDRMMRDFMPKDEDTSLPVGSATSFEPSVESTVNTDAIKNRWRALLSAKFESEMGDSDEHAEKMLRSANKKENDLLNRAMEGTIKFEEAWLKLLALLE